MKKLISFKAAGNWALTSLILLAFFHLVIILGLQFTDLISHEYLWGGRMNSREQLLYFEGASLLMAIVFLGLVLLRTKRLRVNAMQGFSRLAMWVLFGLFLLNTLGNLAAQTSLEKYFAIFTALLSFLFLRLAFKEER